MSSMTRKTKANAGGASAYSGTANTCPRRDRFVQEYLADPRRNATTAYVRAGYTATGTAARAAAARLLKHPQVRKAINLAREIDANKFEVQRQNVIERLAWIAFADPRKAFHPDGSIKLPTELDDATAGALLQYDVTETLASSGQVGDGDVFDDPPPPAVAGTVVTRRTVKARWANKIAALDALVKIMGYANDGGEPAKTDTLNKLLQNILESRSSFLHVVADADDDE